MKPIKSYLITYTNSKGRTLSTTVYSQDKLKEWIDRLDDRIARGTCGGYLITEFTTWSSEQQ